MKTIVHILPVLTDTKLIKDISQNQCQCKAVRIKSMWYKS